MATELAKAYVQIVPSTKGISGAISEALGGESEKAGKSSGESYAESFGGTLKKALVALGIGKVIKDAISSGSEYETAIAKMGTIADTSAVSLDSMKSTIASMSDQLGISQADLAEAAYSTISATGDTAGALDLVNQAAQLATAGFTDTDSAISVLTTSLNAYGLEASDAEHISDSLITTQNLGVTTVADLAANMGRAIATASGYGVSLENLEAAYIGTTKSGISTAESTTYISGMLNELGKSGSTVSDILIDKTGKSFGELMADGSSLGDVLGVVMDSVDGNSEAFMNLWGSQEAGKAANAIVNQGLETFNENLETLETQAGTTETAYGQMTDTFAWKMQDVQTKAQNLGIKLFEALYPVLDDLMEKATELIDNIDIDQLSADISAFAGSVVDAVSQIDIGQVVQDVSAFISAMLQQLPGIIDFLAQLAPVIQQVADFIGDVISNADLIVPIIAAIAGLSIGAKIAGVVTTIISLVGQVSALGGILPAIQAVIAGLGGPVTIIISLIAAAGAALVALYNNNEDFRNFVDTTWAAIKDAVGTAIDAIVAFWEGTLKPAFQAIGDFCVNTLWPAIQTVWEGYIQPVIEAVFNAIKTAWETVLQPAFQAIGDFVQNILWPVIQVVFMMIGEIVSAAFDTIKGAWDNILQPVFTAIGSFISGTLGPVFQTVFNVIKSVVQTVFNAIKGFWNSVLRPVFTAIGTAAGTMRNTAQNAFNAVRSVVQTVFNAVKGFWNSILKPVFTAIGSAASSMRSAVQGPLNAVKSAFSTVFNGIKRTVSPIVNWLKGIFNFKWSLPSIKLPHFSISGSFSLAPPSVPHLSVSWYKTGGIFDTASLIGVGEAGSEAVLPLDSFYRYMDRKFDDYSRNDLTAEDIYRAVKAGFENSNVTISVREREIGRVVRSVG